MLQLYFEIIKCKLFSLRIHNQFITLALSVYLKISVTRMQPGYYLLQVLLILSWKRWVMCFFMNRVKYTKWINMPGLHFLHISVTLCYQFQSGGASVEIEFTATSSANSTDGIAAWKRWRESWFWFLCNQIIIQFSKKILLQDLHHTAFSILWK